MNGIFKVVQQGQALTRPSKKTEGGQVKVCNITLQEMGGKYADEFYATMLGNTAECRFFEGDVVAAALKFSVQERNEATYQDVLVTDIHKISK